MPGRNKLPSFFRESSSNTAQAVRLMADMQQRLLLHFEEQASFLRSMQDPGNLSNERSIKFIPMILAYISEPVWGRLSTRQKEKLSVSYMLVDPVNRTCRVPGLKTAQRITSSLLKEGFNLNLNFDYTVNSGIITFNYAIDPDEWDRTPVVLTINGRPIPMEIQALPVLLENAVISQDWYYKRLGILTGLTENRPPAEVLALYRIILDGCTDNNLDALLAAFSGYSISLRNQDKVASVSENSIRTVRESYTSPSQGVGILQPGSVVNAGDSLFRGIFIISGTSHGDWASNATLLNALRNVDPFFENKVKALLSDNAIMWGDLLPVRVSPGDESLGLWVDAPVISLPVLQYKAGSDAIARESSAVNIVIYSSLDYPADIPVSVVYNAGAAAVTGFGTSAVLSREGVFQFSNGVAGRVLNKALNGTWTGYIEQQRSTVRIVSCSTEKLLLGFDVTAFNYDFHPEKGDWVQLTFDGTTWVKLRIDKILYDEDMNITGAEVYRYGAASLSTGIYPCLIMRSYDGEWYSGVDAVRIDAFERLLTLVTRHIELIVINGGVYSETTARSILDRFRDKLNVWKAYIIVNTADKDTFIKLKEKADEYIQ